MTETEKDVLRHKAIMLAEQLRELEKDFDVNYCVDHHNGVYYAFKLIPNRHWVCYIGFPEYIEVNDKKYYYLNNEEPELSMCPRFETPSEITLAGIGMKVNIISDVPIKWLGFDYAHRGDLTLPELKGILEKLNKGREEVYNDDDFEHYWDIDCLSEAEKLYLNNKFYTYEDVKKDCIDCINSANNYLVDSAVADLMGDLHTKMYKNNK
jgi:hypothetical protein